MLESLNKEYKQSLSYQKDLLNKESKINIRKLSDSSAIKLYKKELSLIKNKRLNAIKTIYRQRVKTFTHLKKHATKDQLLRKINQWKIKGYDTTLLEKRYKLPTVKKGELFNQIKKWKSKGFNTKVLDDKLKKK